MVDMRETAILPPRGSLRIVGKAHGALNTVVCPVDGSQWYFKQFVSPEQLYEFAQTYHLTLTGELPNDCENNHSA